MHWVVFAPRTAVRYCGSCVDLPDPVSPTTMVVRWALTDATMASLYAATGSCEEEEGEEGGFASLACPPAVRFMSSLLASFLRIV